MSACVLLNLLNKLGKRDQMRGLLSILSLFRNKFNKIQLYKSMNIRFYLSYDIKITLKSHFCNNKLQFCHYVRNVDKYGCYNVSVKSVNH